MRTLLIAFFTFCSFTVSAQLFVKSIYDTILGTSQENSTFKHNADSTYSVFEARDGLISMRLDNSGNIMSSNTISIGGTTWDGRVEMDTFSDSLDIIAGSCFHTTYTNHNVVLLKINRLGQPLWMRSIGSSFFEEQAFKVKHLQAGGFIIAGHKNYGTLTFSTGGAYLLKTDDSGNVAFAKGFHIEGGYATDIIETGSAFFTTGQTSYFGRPTFAFLLKTDKAGNTLWAKGYDSSFSVSQSLLKDGNYFLLAGIGLDLNGDAVLMKVDTIGNTIWSKKYHLNGASYAEMVIKTIDGGYLLSGVTEEATSHPHNRGHPFFIKTDSAGNVQWCKKYGSLYPQYGSGNMLQEANGNFVSIGQYYTGIVALLMYATDSAGNGSGICEEAYTPVVIPMAIGNSAITFTDSFYNDSSTAYPLTVITNGMVAVDSCIIGTEGIANVSVNSINLYPNPSTGIFTIETSVSNCDIEVYNFLGERVYRQTMSGKTDVIDLTQFARGLYLCVVKGPDGSLWRSAFVLR